MADPIDELYARWSQNTADAAVTLALCEALRGSNRSSLIDIVGEVTARDYATNAAALVATGRMYMEAQRLEDAQTVLVTAGKLAPRDGSVYRWLGEVLLRQGDAERAEKVLERAFLFGASDEGARLWMDRAKVFRPMQAKAGARAVAAEIAKTAGLQSSAPLMPAEQGDEETTTEVFSSGRAQQLQREIAAATKHLIEDPLEETKKRTLAYELLHPGPLPEPRPGADFDFATSEEDTTVTKTSPLGYPKRIDVAASAPKSLPTPMGAMQTAMGLGVQQVEGAPAVSGPTPTPAVAARTMSPFMELPLAPLSAATPPPPASIQDGPALPPYMPPPSVPPHATGTPSTADASVPAKKRTPDPRDVLDALELAGVFEPDARVPADPRWDNAGKGPRRIKSYASLFVATALFVGAGFGTYRYVRSSRAKRHAMAEEILGRVETDLHAARPGGLGAIEQQIGRAFDLDSRSPRAARDWLRERALVGLVKGSFEVAFEDAISRAKEVKVEGDQLAFALLASFLFQGDTAGAAGLMPKWDAVSKNDPFYQLIAGATLERAGAPSAAERYAAATKLDPELAVAEMLLARSVAIEGDPQKAMELAKAFRGRYPDRAEGVALLALAWVRDPARGSDEPNEVSETIARAAELPAPLAFVPHAMQALRALDKHSPEDAKASIQKGLVVADTPGQACWLGTIALDTGDEQLARKAALRAVGFSAVYGPARVLAARVALLGARLDEALKATDELDASSPDVAVVHAAVAYEKLDTDALSRALAAIPTDAKKIPFLASLSDAPAVLDGRLGSTPAKLVARASNEAPWSDLLAMDMALDSGDLDAAQKIAQLWKGTEKNPLRALRLSRLARYSGRLDDADPLSETALSPGAVTVRSISERVFVLVARAKHAEVTALLAKYPHVAGPLGTWLSAYATAAAGKVEDARGKIAQLDPPPITSPLPARIIAAMALGATKDQRRGKRYVKAILSSGIANADAGAAGVALGAKKVNRPGRPPQYVGP